MVRIRPARTEELGGLPALEAAADELLAARGIEPLPPPGTPEQLAQALVVLVADEGNGPLGFARVDRVGAGAHLEQLSVHPDHGRRGVGRALLEAACARVAEAGYGELTLCTFADVPFNGPFYRSAGFVVLDTEAGWLAAHGLADLDRLDRFGPRVAMGRDLV